MVNYNNKYYKYKLKYLKYKYSLGGSSLNMSLNPLTYQNILKNKIGLINSDNTLYLLIQKFTSPNITTLQILSVSPGHAITINESSNSYIITFPKLGNITQHEPITITNHKKTTYLFGIINPIQTHDFTTLHNQNLDQAAEIFKADNFNVIDFVKPLVNLLADGKYVDLENIIDYEIMEKIIEERTKYLTKIFYPLVKPHIIPDELNQLFNQEMLKQLFNHEELTELFKQE